MNRFFVEFRGTVCVTNLVCGLKLLLALICLSWQIQASAADSQEFPYTAYATGAQTYVRSGPGQRYYPTGQVPEGFAVEVYRHEADGWCAVRPTEGSFSWVPSHQVRQVEQNVVEVIDDQVVARVGSALSPDRSAVQVLLPKGERVALLPADPNDDPRWLRIAPPSGEFRWIAASSLSRQPPIETAPRIPTPPSVWGRQSGPDDTVAIIGNDEFAHLTRVPTVNNEALQFGQPRPLPPNQPMPLQPAVPTLTDGTNNVDPNAMDIVAGSPAELQLAQFEGGIEAGVSPVTSEYTSSQPRIRFDTSNTAKPIAVNSVEELETRLSQTVVQPPQQWDLAPLEAAANKLLAATKAPAVRAQLREVLERIARFQEIRQRYEQPTPPMVAERDPFEQPSLAVDSPTELTGLTSDIRARVREDLSAGRRGGTPESAPTAEQPLYAATGLLKPVVSQRPQAPDYALVDERGKVVSFVTSTPELNLKPYVGQRIGVHGTRGFMPEYKRAHVTAGRVTPLEGTIRR